MKRLNVVNYIVIIGTWCAFVGGGKARPGVWMDDGFGRTVKAEMGPVEAELLEQDMLHALGLPTPPRHHRHHYHAKGSAPNFLKNIYESLDERGHAPHLDPGHRATVGAADTIITFINRDPPKGRPKHKGNRILYFNVADVSLDHSLLSAELRLHRRQLPRQHEDLTLHVYMNTDRGDREIVTTPLPAEGWISVNVTSAALSWIIFPKTNLGLRIGVTRPAVKHEMHLHEVGVSGAHDEEDLRPFMAGFFAFPESAKRKKRVQRSTKNQIPKKSQRVSMSTMLSDRPYEKDTRHLCAKRQLYVSFKDLGWDRWVIAPIGYDANFCQGNCDFPMPSELNATNHAYVQNLVKILGNVSGNKEPPPPACCAPKDLITISVLYYDYSTNEYKANVILRKYSKMIVKNCGCL